MPGRRRLIAGAGRLGRVAPAIDERGERIRPSSWDLVGALPEDLCRAQIACPAGGATAA